MKIGFIGCGNMGGALASAVAKSPSVRLLLSDKSLDKAQALAAELGATVSDNLEISKSCDFIFLGVKPNLLSEVLPPLASALASNPSSVIVSMAAGVRIERLGNLIGTPHPIIRIMPNTPVMVGCGMITWCPAPTVDAERTAAFVKIMSHAGALDKISEENMDAATAVAGCGPAFVYMFLDALAKGGEICGLDRERARYYACQTLKGAAEMVEKTGKEPHRLKTEVCSPGGSTIEGVSVLERGGLGELCAAAVKASFEKNKRLGG